MDISVIFKNFAFVFFALAAIVALVLLVVTCRKMREVSEQLRKVFRDLIVVGVMFGLFSWFLS